MVRTGRDSAQRLAPRIGVERVGVDGNRRRMGLQRRYLRGNRPRQVGVVAIEPCQHRSARPRPTPVNRISLAGIFAHHHLHPRVAGKRAQHRWRLITAAAVDHPHFQIGIFLRQNAAQRIANVAPLIQRWHDNAHQRLRRITDHRRRQVSGELGIFRPERIFSREREHWLQRSNPCRYERSLVPYRLHSFRLPAARL